MTPTRSVPISVARAMVRCGSITRPAGTVPDSKPSMVHRASAAAPAMAGAAIGVGATNLVVAAELSLLPSTMNTARITANNGRSLRMVVTTWTVPEAFTPRSATPVIRTTKPMATSGPAAGRANNPGAKGWR